MPEPLRSQLLYGDMTIRPEDDKWQVIPTAWIESAFERWRAADPASAGDPTHIYSDVSVGGPDSGTVGIRRGDYIDEIDVYERLEGLMLGTYLIDAARKRAATADVGVDADGPGAAVYEFVRDNLPGRRVMAFHGGAKPPGMDATGQNEFLNMRAWGYWHLRDLLDPARGSQVCLPPSDRLLAELAAQRWRPQPATGKIVLWPKEKIRQIIGHSPDMADTVMMLMAGDATAPRISFAPRAGAIPARKYDPEEEDRRAAEMEAANRRWNSVDNEALWHKW